MQGRRHRRVCAAWPDTSDNVEVIESTGPTPASPGRRRRRRRRRRGDNRSRHGEPLSPRSDCLGTVRVGGRTSELDAARHIARLRSAYPTDRLLVVFEIDGPIVDQRHTVRRRLLDYDRVHGTDHFRGVEVADVDTDVGNLEPFLIR